MEERVEKYDINDPTDLDIMRNDFDYITSKEWKEYIEWAEDKNMGYKNINALKSAERKAGISKFLSAKMVRWCLSIVDRVEEAKEEAAKKLEDEDE